MSYFKKLQMQGFSLLELMIAMFIGLFLTGAAGTLLINNKRAYVETERYATIQENARFAMEQLLSSVRLAGFWGDMQNKDFLKTDQITSTNDCSGDATFTEPYPALFVVKGNNSNVSSCLTGEDAASDVIVAKSVDPAVIYQATSATDDTKPSGLVNTKAYLATGLERAAFFKGSASKLPLPGTSVYEYKPYIYYVANNVLMRKGIDGIAVEMVPGVEKMRIMVRLPKQNFVNVDDTSLVGKWDQITALKIYLLIRTDQDLQYKNTKTYKLADSTYASSGDHYHRVALAFTMLLPNNTAY